jgi:DNA mismatch repair protein MutS
MTPDDQSAPAVVRAGGETRVSVLWEAGAPPAGDVGEPECFVDLNLNQIAKDVLAGFEIYELMPVLRTPLRTVEAVRYRQAVMADVERSEVQKPIRAFAATMGHVRWCLARVGKIYDERQQQRWFLDAVDRYVEGLGDLLRALLAVELGSTALRRFRDHLATYASAPAFIAMAAERERLVKALADIRYVVRMRGLRVDVAGYEGQPDYSQAVLQTFERFRQGGDGRDFTFDMPDYADMNHVEASILEQLAKMHEDLFRFLASFRSEHTEFQDPTVVRFDREIQFYLAYLDYVAPLRRAGLPFCAPQMVGPDSDLKGVAVFDLALAKKLIGAKAAPPVANDFSLSGPERILVVSGPNQGGKTTFARTFGQVHYLGCLGLPVPGERASLRLFDHLFTHFERGENTGDLRGKLEDDLVRVHDMLATASPSTVIIFNEMFTSTTFRDALVLSKAVMQLLVDGRLSAVWVTFIDELASWNEHTVSMVSNVDREDLTKRTYKIVRRPADGLAYALSIAQKWKVTLPQIRERLSA